MQLYSLIPAALFAVTSLAVANDNFADAEAIVFQGTTISRSGDTNNATVEPGEPNPLGAEQMTASYWYALTVGTAGRVQIKAITSNVDAVIAVFTGTSLDNLQVASRYSTMDFPAVSRRGRNSTSESFRPSEPLSEFALVTLDAIPGETYYISITGEGNTRGNYTLEVSATRNNLVPVLELLPARSLWSSLIHRNGSGVPIAPDTTDPDFYTTWQTPAEYNGPAFSTPVAAPIGYGGDPLGTTGGINAFKLPPAKSLWLPDSFVTPPSGSRYTSYHRTAFTPSASITALAIEGVFDDGAIFFINGSEVGRLNMPGDAVADNWTQLSNDQSIPGVGTTEDEIQYLSFGGLNLPAGQPVDFALSLHNQTASSSDMGFDLRLFAAGAIPVEGTDRIELSIIQATLANRYLLTWPAFAGKAYNIEQNNTPSDTGWTVVNSSPIEPASDGPVTELVLSSSSKSFWRVVTTDPAP